MRTLAIITSMVVIGVALLFMSGATAQSLDHDIVILDDVTDKHQLTPQFDLLVEHLGLEENPWQGVRLTYATITDLMYNQERSYTLERAKWWWSNEFDRKEQLLGFTEFTTSLSNSIHVKDSAKNHSAIYRPLVNNLNKLSKSNAENRSLILYSDMMENDLVSFYHPDTLSLVKHQSETIERLLTNQGRLLNLEGITIYLVYAPTTRKEDQRFSIVAPFFQSLLESHGARVFLQTGLSIIR